MIEATQRVYERVIAGELSHDGDRDLIRHVTNAVLKTDGRGSRLVKESKNSKRHIDLAVAMVMAVDRAAALSSGQYANVIFASDMAPASEDPEIGPSFHQVGMRAPVVLGPEDYTECFACKVGGCTIHRQEDS
jgi:hypothetical protein